jgi:hypothetical protein
MKREHITGSRTAGVSLRLSPLEDYRDRAPLRDKRGALFCSF